jgi:hypothetical protein
MFFVAFRDVSGLSHRPFWCKIPDNTAPEGFARLLYDQMRAQFVDTLLRFVSFSEFLASARVYRDTSNGASLADPTKAKPFVKALLSACRNHRQAHPQGGTPKASKPGSKKAPPKLADRRVVIDFGYFRRLGLLSNGGEAVFASPSTNEAFRARAQECARAIAESDLVRNIYSHMPAYLIDGWGVYAAKDDRYLPIIPDKIHYQYCQLQERAEVARVAKVTMQVTASCDTWKKILDILAEGDRHHPSSVGHLRCRTDRDTLSSQPESPVSHAPGSTASVSCSSSPTTVNIPPHVAKPEPHRDDLQ